MSDPIRSLEAILRESNGAPLSDGAPRLRAVGVVRALLIEVDHGEDARAGEAPYAALVLASERDASHSPPSATHAPDPAAVAPADYADPVRARFGLSPREASVARLVAAGLSNRDVAASLGLSPFTARNHTARVLAKTGVPSRARLAALFGELDGARREPAV